jgi:hypothetical protein
LRDVNVTVDETIDQGSDDFRAVYPSSLVTPNLSFQLIQVEDLTLEQHDRDLCPWFVVHRRPATGPRRRPLQRGSFAGMSSHLAEEKA